MTTYKKDTRSAIIIIVALLLLSFTGFFWYKDHQSLQKESAKEKLRQDSVRNEKLLLDKEITEMRSSLLTWKSKCSRLDSSLQRSEHQLIEKTRIIKSLQAENLSVKRLKKELKELKEIRQILEARMNALLVENKQLKDELARLKEELANKNIIEKPEIIFSLDNFKISTEKKNSKLTVKAKRVKTIQLNFDIKNNQKETSTETLYLVLKDNNGNALGSKGNSTTVLGESLVYANLQKIEVGEHPKKVSATLKLDTKLKAKG